MKAVAFTKEGPLDAIQYWDLTVRMQQRAVRSQTSFRGCVCQQSWRIHSRKGADQFHSGKTWLLQQILQLCTVRKELPDLLCYTPECPYIYLVFWIPTCIRHLTLAEAFELWARLVKIPDCKIPNSRASTRQFAELEKMNFTFLNMFSEQACLRLRRQYHRACTYLCD